MRTLRLILFLLSILTLFSCFRCVDHKELVINNNSKKSIFLTLSPNDEVFDYEKFLVKERLDNGEKITGTINLSGLFFSDEITPNSIYNWGPTSYLKGYINYNCNEKKTRVFIIEKDSVDKYGWKKIHKMKIYNKKYTFSYEELEKNNWEIQYN